MMAVIFWGFTFLVAALLPLGETVFSPTLAYKKGFFDLTYMIQIGLAKLFITYGAAALLVWFFMRTTNLKRRLLPLHPGRNLLIAGMACNLFLGIFMWMPLFAHIYKNIPLVSIIFLIPPLLFLTGSVKVLLCLGPPDRRL